MLYTEATDKARTNAQAALDKMAELGIPPNPQNFTVWYNYLAGNIPDLGSTVDALLAGDQAFTPALSQELFKQFFGDEHERRLLDATNEKIRAATGQLLKLIVETGDGAADYGAALKAFAEELGESSEQDDVVRLSAAILAATRRMGEHNRGFESQLATSSAEIDRLKKDLDRVRREATTDALTGIANRRHFDEHLRQLAREAAERSAPGAAPLSLLMIDIDHFKKFNDSHGHPLGDQVIRLVAKTLVECVKGRDLPARYGGEEFAIVLPETGLDDAVTVAEQVRCSLASKTVIKKKTGEVLDTITVSIGVAELAPGEAVAELVARADRALYRAKNEGRNRVNTDTAIAAPLAATA